MARYTNVSNQKESTARVEVSKSSYFLLYIDETGDGDFEKFILPDEIVKYNEFVYELPDTDKDGVNDFIDNCQDIPNPDQQDFNKDKKGDVCDNPNFYKQNALKLLSSIIPINQKEEVKIRLTERAINESLMQEYWDDDFTVNNKKVFLDELFAVQHGEEFGNVSYLLVKADLLIIEYQLLTDINNEKLSQAKELYEAANESLNEGDYKSAILNYLKGWDTLYDNK